MSDLSFKAFFTYYATNLIEMFPNFSYPNPNPMVRGQGH